MPKSYEEEIRDLLRGMDGFPGESRESRSQPNRSRRRWSWPRWGGAGWPNAQRMMGGALLLMLFGWVLRFSGVFGFTFLVLLAGYVSLASIVLFVIALLMLVRGGSFGGSIPGGGGGQQVRWRGQVIRMPGRTGPIAAVRRWWRRLSSRSSRASGGSSPRRPNSRGRDSFQW
jgi:hypothetical protein